MRILRDISEPEVVLTFLRAELESGRYRGLLEWVLARRGQTRSLIDDANLGQQAENDLRRSILDEESTHQGGIEVTSTLPKNLVWTVATLEATELLHLKYVNIDHWTSFACGSRFVEDGVKTVLAGGAIIGIAQADFRAAMARCAVGENPHRPILVATDQGSTGVILDGSLRITSLAALLLENAPAAAAEVEVILGCSREVSNWPLF
jgi:hypothetical protein